eukprot:298019_1
MSTLVYCSQNEFFPVQYTVHSCWIVATILICIYGLFKMSHLNNLNTHVICIFVATAACIVLGSISLLLQISFCYNHILDQFFGSMFQICYVIQQLILTVAMLYRLKFIFSGTSLDLNPLLYQKFKYAIIISITLVFIGLTIFWTFRNEIIFYLALLSKIGRFMTVIGVFIVFTTYITMLFQFFKKMNILMLNESLQKNKTKENDSDLKFEKINQNLELYQMSSKYALLSLIGLLATLILMICICVSVFSGYYSWLLLSFILSMDYTIKFWCLFLQHRAGKVFYSICCNYFDIRLMDIIRNRIQKQTQQKSEHIASQTNVNLPELRISLSNRENGN